MGPWWVWGLVLAPGRWGQVLGCMIAGLWVRDLVLACWWVWPEACGYLLCSVANSETGDSKLFKEFY